MAAIFSIIESTCLRNDLYPFKINSSNILFHYSTVAVISGPIFWWEAVFVLLMSGLDGGHEETPIISENILAWFRLKQIIDSLTFFIYLAHSLILGWILMKKCLDYTGWNDKIVVLKKTTLQIYFKTFIEKINSANLIM